jgi:hypothetical protein
MQRDVEGEHEKLSSRHPLAALPWSSMAGWSTVAA